MSVMHFLKDGASNPTPVSGLNPLPVNASVTATASTVGTATASAPSYTEGQSDAPLSLDLSGNLRVAASVSVALSDASHVTGTASSAATLFTSDTTDYHSVAVQITAIAGSSTLVGEVSNDNSTWVAIKDVKGNSSFTSTGVYVFPCDALYFRLRQSVYGGSGTTSADAYLRGTQVQSGETQPVSLSTLPALVAGTAIVGKVGIDQTTDGTTNKVYVGNTVAVSGTFYQATQPVSAASLPLPSGASTSAKQDSIITALGSPFQAGGSIGNTSFGVSGTLPAFAATPTFNLGTLNGAATSAKQDSIITALGSPFQAGASIGNTSFGISGTLPAYAAIPAFKTDLTTPGTTNLVSIGTDGLVRTTTRAKTKTQYTAISATSSSTEYQIVPADATYKLDIFRLLLTNRSTGTDTYVTIKDSTAGNTLAKIALRAMTNGGFSGPVEAAWPQATKNKKWVALVATTGVPIEVTASYYQAST